MSADDQTTPVKIFAITEPAREKILRVRADQPDSERLALRVEVSGVSRGEYDSSASFQLLDDIGPHEVAERHEELVVVCRVEDVDKLSGATVEL